jgi:endonuclease YncB( thermonuclease family)
MPVQIFWDPSGFELDSLGSTKINGPPTDGDTPYIRTAIRMLSIDTPEVHYPGNSNPSNHDAKLAELATWLRAGSAPASDALAANLMPKLATGNAGSLQKSQGDQATAHFKTLLDTKLTKPNGKKRSVYLRAADEHFDQYGRLLAYMAPYYTAAELDQMDYKDRATFNLLMVESGWAATLAIYPSLPRYRDLVLLQQTAQQAYEQHRGAWAEPLSLTGYEFRMCYKLWDVTKKLTQGKKLSTKEKYGWVERYCADMTTRQIYEPQDYIKIEPYNRIFIWAKDVTDAVGKLNLVPSQ